MTASTKLRHCLPREHGAWVFLLLPLLAGLLLAPSVAGSLLSLAALAAFFARIPLQRLRAAPRDATYALAAIAMLLLAAACLLFSVRGAPLALLPLAAGALAGLPGLRPIAATRTLKVELLGVFALSALLPALLLVAHQSPTAAGLAWAALLLLELPSLCYVRARVRQTRKGGAKEGGLLPTQLLHGAGFAAALLLWVWAGLAPWVALWCALLLLRALLLRDPAPARRLGWGEAAVSMGHLAVLVIAFRGV